MHNIEEMMMIDANRMARTFVQPMLASFAFCFVTLCGSAQTMIKGHHLGETAQEFLSVEPEIRAHLASCDAHKRSVSATDVRSMPEPALYRLAVETSLFLNRNDNIPDRAQLVSLAEEGKLVIVDLPDLKEKFECIRVMLALESNLTKDFGRSAKDSREVWLFSEGRLVSMRLELPGSSFGQLEADLVKKLGSKPLETHPALQNAMGASWIDNDATWLNKELYADL